MCCTAATHNRSDRDGLSNIFMSAYGTNLTRIGRQSMSALPLFSDFDLLGNRKRVANFDPEIANRALNFCVAKQKLNRSKVPRLFVDLGSLGPPE
jgi:hypothetical protein